MNKNYSLYLYLVISLLYLEFVFKIFFSYNLTFLSFVFPIIIASILYLFIRFFDKRIQKILSIVFLFIISFYFAVQLCMYQMYSFFFDFGLLAAANQIGAFYSDIFDLLLNNLWYLILLFLPLIIFVIFNKKIYFEKTISLNGNFVLMSLILLLLGYNPIYYSTDVSIINNGVIGTFISDIKGGNKSNELILQEEVEEETKEEVVEEKVYNPQILNIDFDLASSSNSSIQNLNEYFSNLSPTFENDYTGLFKDKNLILVMGETFNSMAVRKDITPTLYKMIHEGFTFNNYYTTSYNSTVGGEFQLLNGMFASSGAIGTWKAGTNSFPMGLPNLFKQQGYNIHAYHDHSYSYMDRNKYLNAYGFENYMGCFNGLEKRMKCGLLFEKDSEMAEVTIDDYINDDKFFTYYVTVSGHGPYTFNTEKNMIGVLHKDEIKEKGYELNDRLVAYMSGMVELDLMMEKIIDELKINNKLDDTVIIIVGDHYPYYLSSDEIRQLGVEVNDEEIDVCKNDLIIYNSSTEKIVCDKVGNTMDVLPTIYNLFGIKYDSRLIPGSDLLSNKPGYAIFGNYSWISDKGIYYSHLNKFVTKENEDVDDDYFEKTNKTIKTKVSLTNLIFNTNYYKYISDFIK